MEHINTTTKTGILGLLGLIGSFIAKMLGGWDTAMQTLLIFMAVDFITGLVVAGVFKNSIKTENGGLKSEVGFKGLIKKGMMLLIVLVAVRLDITIGTDFIRNTTIIAFLLNEILSLTENAGLMGIPIPPVISNAIEILRTKSEREGHKNE